MMDGILLIIIGALCSVAIIVSFRMGKKQGNKEAIQPTLIKNDCLIKERDNLKTAIVKYQKMFAEECKKLNDVKNQIDSLNQSIEEKNDYLHNYQETLNQAEKLKEEQLQKQYDIKKSYLESDYQKEQEKILAIQSELESLKNTRAAIIEAHKREQELNNNDFYVLQIPDDELDDIHYLERIKTKLHFPIVIGKVIWTTFIQKKVNALAARVLPQKVTTGIYKITNLNTNECYIGQSVDIRQRFIDHCKAGLGAVEASVSNKLYAAMRQDGIENFAFELLEECSREQLNEKERYYIELYNADTTGYNGNKGISNG